MTVVEWVFGMAELLVQTMVEELAIWKDRLSAEMMAKR